MPITKKSEAIEWQGTVAYVKAAADITESVAFVAMAGVTPAKITRGSGSFVTDGFQLGDMIASSSSNNPGPFVISSVAALEMELEETYADVADESSASFDLEHFIAIGEIHGTSGLGSGSATTIDVTHNRSAIKEKKKGLRDAGEMTIPGNLIPTDLGQQRCRALWIDPDPGEFMVAMVNGSRREFDALVMSFAENGERDGTWTFELALNLTGDVLYADPA